MFQELNAEIVVALEGTNEFGDTFATRQSYLPSEISWGHVFRYVALQALQKIVYYTLFYW